MNISQVAFGLLLFVSYSCLVISETVDPDAGEIADIIESRGFKCESHYVTTEDGYILGTYRIVNPLVRRNPRKALGPVLIQSGFLGSGVDFLINAPDGFVEEDILANQNDLTKIDFGVKGRNLGFLLANLGYDVWIMNARGNHYSRNHSFLNPDDDKDKRFWSVSMDEIALIDLPNVIDYVLRETRQKSLGYIGYSRGSISMFALLADKPEFARKVKPFIALAPAVFMQHLESPLRFLVQSSLVNNALLGNPGECFPRAKAQYTGACGIFIFRPVCDFIKTSLLSLDKRNVNESRLAIYTKQVPAGSACWDLVHFSQAMSKQDFRKIDLGKAKNMEKYGKAEPPRYPLENIVSKDIAIIKSVGDKTANVPDIEDLKNLLKVPLASEVTIMQAAFTHLDFIYNTDVGNIVNQPIATILSKYR